MTSNQIFRKYFYLLIVSLITDELFFAFLATKFPQYPSNIINIELTIAFFLFLAVLLGALPHLKRSRLRIIVLFAHLLFLVLVVISQGLETYNVMLDFKYNVQSALTMNCMLIVPIGILLYLDVVLIRERLHVDYQQASLAVLLISMTIVNVIVLCSNLDVFLEPHLYTSLTIGILEFLFLVVLTKSIRAMVKLKREHTKAQSAESGFVTSQSKD